MSFRQVNEVNAAGIPPLRRILARFAARMTLGLHISKLLPIDTRIVFPGLILLSLLFIFINGCGDTPSGPPEVKLGAIELWPMDPDSNLLPEATVILDDDSSTLVQGAVPILITGIIPGNHNIHIEYQDYQTTSEVYVSAGDTTVFQPILTQFAPDFVMPGLFYDFSIDTIAYVDSVRLSDFWRDTLGNVIAEGEVVLLFFFNDG